MVFRFLVWLARVFALLGGLLITLIAGMTCLAIAARELAGWSMAGDFELSAAAAGVAVALFLPMCHLRGGNIIVDAFTSAMPGRWRANLDRMGCAALSLLAALLAWRTAEGAYSAFTSQSASMLLGLPEWLVYAGMVPPLLLTAVIAAAQVQRRHVL